MPAPDLDAFSLLESSFNTSPNFRSRKSLPRHRIGLRSILPDIEPFKQDLAQSDDESESQPGSEHLSRLASPASVSGAESGLPPTPPSNSQDEQPSSTFSPPSYADGVVTSLMSKQSSLSTPVNQRSPPTPDPSPPRTKEFATPNDRPILFAYPSSRAESFKTAREEPLSSDAGDSRSQTPLIDRLSTVEEDHGSKLPSEREESDVTPTNAVQDTASVVAVDNERDTVKDDPLDVEQIPNREWNTDLMRNVTIRRKKNPKPSPRKNTDSAEPSSPATGTTPRRASSLRERIEASKNSPHTPSIESFAQSIGWPAESDSTIPANQARDADHKRLSVSSMSSTVVEAMVIVTPPQKQRSLRHSGKNLAYRRDADSVTDRSSMTYSNRTSLASDDVPLHRLVHKRASIGGAKPRGSLGSETMSMDRYASPLSIRKRNEESAAYTLAHQESVRRVLQPAAEVLSRANSLSRPYASERSYHKRIVSAPEVTRRRENFTPEPRGFLELSSLESPRRGTRIRSPEDQRSLPPTSVPKSSKMPASSLRSRTGDQESINSTHHFDLNKSLPRLPLDSAEKGDIVQESSGPDENQRPTEPLATVTTVTEPHDHEVAQPERESLKRRESSSETVPTIRRGSFSTRGRSEERRRSSTSQDRTSTSRDALLRPPLDRAPTDELPRHSSEWHALHPDGTRRVSFDSSTIRTEEHAMARHLYAQTTPFSQISDTPIEVSEATAVSIYPHNNHSLLVVQQLARSSTQTSETRRLADEPHYTTSLLSPDANSPPTPPFVDADELQHSQPLQPTLTFEPSTPPMQLLLPAIGVDSPLKNPRPPPDPPIIQFIPPTPAEELERSLTVMPTPPGPPKRSDSHPQRRLSLVQRARRYSGNIISPFLSRSSSTRSRGSHPGDGHGNPRIPTVNDEDGSLHPFWRPRGFWDGFEDSDSESDEDVLPSGGDTSDIPDPEPEKEARKLGVLGRRLTNGFRPSNTKNSGGFLIGNSLGVERAGSNKRRHVIDRPARVLPPPRRVSTSPKILIQPPRRVSTSPKILIQPPTLPMSFRSRSPRVEKRGSRGSLQSTNSAPREWRRDERRSSWKNGKTIPGLNMQVQYIGLSGVKERIRERRAEKRREILRRSIGSRYYVEGGGVNLS